MRQRIRVLMTQILLDQGKASQAYEYMRGVCHQWPESVAVWNLYARVAAAVGSAGHGSKLLTPLRQKIPHSVPLMVNLAHCCAMQVRFPIYIIACMTATMTTRLQSRDEVWITVCAHVQIRFTPPGGVSSRYGGEHIGRMSREWA
jgi:hypothetical protein